MGSKSEASQMLSVMNLVLQEKSKKEFKKRNLKEKNKKHY